MPRSFVQFAVVADDDAGAMHAAAAVVAVAADRVVAVVYSPGVNYPDLNYSSIVVSTWVGP